MFQVKKNTRFKSNASLNDILVFTGFFPPQFHSVNKNISCSHSQFLLEDTYRLEGLGAKTGYCCLVFNWLRNWATLLFRKSSFLLDFKCCLSIFCTVDGSQLFLFSKCVPEEFYGRCTLHFYMLQYIQNESSGLKCSHKKGHILSSCTKSHI